MITLFQYKNFLAANEFFYEWLFLTEETFSRNEIYLVEINMKMKLQSYQAFNQV